MRIALLSLIFVCATAYSQHQETFEVGAPTMALDQWHTVYNKFWKIISLDDEVSVSVLKGDMYLSVFKHHGLICFAVTCGFDKRTGYFNTSTMQTLYGTLPLVIPEGAEVHFECPPGSYAHMSKLVPN
ncbi:MAG: hypothetical protein JST66_07520 [Bacteroidetes bacterium]|nr:hypothetical protein [Bacteroidota bacterium]